MSATAAIVAICLAVFAQVSALERRRYVGNDTVFHMEKTLSIITLIVAILAGCLALYWLMHEPHYVGQEGDAFVPAFLGFCSSLCAVIWSLYEVRLGEEQLFYGIKGRLSVSYDSIVEIQDIRNQGSPRLNLILQSGKRIGIWSNLLGYDVLVNTLRSRCACQYTLNKKR